MLRYLILLVSYYAFGNSSKTQVIFRQLFRLAGGNQVTFMPWLPIVVVIISVLLMIILGYFLIRSFLRDYTYDVPSKTQ